MTHPILWGARFVLVAAAGGVVLLGIAMHLYPGGTALDVRAPGHSFWLNFLCDLTAPVARNHAPNPTGSLAARAAMLVLSLALGATWLIVPAFAGSQRGLARVIRGAGALCALALVAVPIAPGTAHVVAIFTSAPAGLVAGVATIVALARSGGPRRRWLPLVFVLLATAADSIFYGQSVATNPRVVLPQLPATQRLAGLLALGWMIATALELLALGRAGGPPSGARAAAGP